MCRGDRNDDGINLADGLTFRLSVRGNFCELVGGRAIKWQYMLGEVLVEDRLCGIGQLLSSLSSWQQTEAIAINACNLLEMHYVKGAPRYVER